MGKQFHNGVILGRFQPLHKGHVYLIETSLSKADRVLILVGSSQESRSKRNPFTYEERKAHLKKVFGDRVMIAPLEDLGVGNVHAWGDYVLEKAAEALGGVDCLFLGEESKNASWLSEEKKKEVAMIEIPRHLHPFSASMVREAIKNSDCSLFKEYMPKPLHDEFESMKAILRQSEGE